MTASLDDVVAAIAAQTVILETLKAQINQVLKTMGRPEL